MHPGAKPSPPVDTTATAAPRDPSGTSEVLQQVKAAVTIERVDRTRNVIVYKTADNQHVTRAVVDPRGQVFAQASRDKDEVLVTDLNLDMIGEVRKTWQFFRDRRPDMYESLVKA